MIASTTTMPITAQPLAQLLEFVDGVIARAGTYMAYGTPDGGASQNLHIHGRYETDIERAERLSREQMDWERNNPVLGAFGSRIAFGGKFALPESDLDILYSAMPLSEAEGRVHDWLKKNPSVAPPEVKLNMINARAHWYPAGYEYQPTQIVWPRASDAKTHLRAAHGFAAAVRAWAMGGARGLPPPNLGKGPEGPMNGEAVLNALEWARRRGIDLNGLVEVKVATP